MRLIDFPWADSCLQTVNIGKLLTPGMRLIDKPGNIATCFSPYHVLACQSSPFSLVFSSPYQPHQDTKSIMNFLPPRVSPGYSAQSGNLPKRQVLHNICMPKRAEQALAYILQHDIFLYFILCPKNATMSAGCNTQGLFIIFVFLTWINP